MLAVSSASVAWINLYRGAKTMHSELLKCTVIQLRASQRAVKRRHLHFQRHHQSVTPSHWVFKLGMLRNQNSHQQLSTQS